jgi:hypothetical protein
MPFEQVRIDIQPKGCVSPFDRKNALGSRVAARAIKISD